MPKMRTGALRKLHADLGQILADYDSSRSEEAGVDGTLNLAGPETEVRNPDDAGAMDAARRSGKGLSMSEAFPGFNRIPNKM